MSYKSLLERVPPLPCLLEKLPASKTPVIDSFVYCALCCWGVHINYTAEGPTQFSITNFSTYWDYSIQTCSKPTPTKEPVSRLKSLRRWFNDFPGIKKLKSVKSGKLPITFSVKDDRKQDMINMVRKITQIINTRCRAAAQSQYSTSIPQMNQIPQYSRTF